MPTETLENVTLYFREGTSDKVYQLKIVESSGSYEVHFAYGRRGSTLKTGSKTTSPVSLGAARRIFHEVLDEKKGKGYTEGAAGTPFTGPSGGPSPVSAPVVGFVPQLLNMISEEEALNLIEDDRYCAQEKCDGERAIVDRRSTEVRAFNKQGKVKTISDLILGVIRSLKQPCTLDGEAIGDKYFTFDLLNHEGADIRTKPYEERYKILESSPLYRRLDIVTAAFITADKRALWEKLRTNKREGIVFKLRSAPYVAGRPSNGGSHLKHKFYATASVRVAKVNDKRSVSVEVLDNTQVTGLDAIVSGAGGTWINVGNVTIPVNAVVPKAGDIVEVRYLYAFPGGSLFQSVYLGPRNDVANEECTAGQLKFKSADDDS